MSDNLISTLLAIGGTIAGAIIGSWSTLRSVRNQQFYSSAAKLKQSFLDVLVLLNLPKDKFIDLYAIEVLDKSFYKQEQAIIEFRYSLPKSKRVLFNNAWLNYIGNETGDDKLTKKYFKCSNWQEEARKNIETILDFTE